MRRAGPADTAQPVERLTTIDLINLRVETAAAPSRVGGVAVLAGQRLRHADGRLRLTAIQGAVDRRLDRVPRLRQIIQPAGPLAGGPVWADDPAFHIARHVHDVRLPAGATLPDLALQLVSQPLPRAHPMWRMWLVTDLPGRQVGLVFAMHHVVADGVATLRMLRMLMDQGDSSDPPSGWTARPAPGWTALVRDNLRRKIAGMRRVGRLPAALGGQWRALRQTRRAPRIPLNRPVGARRRMTTVTMDLATIKEVAHRHRGTVNDVVLALAAGGVHALLASRSVPTNGLALQVSVMVAPRTPAASSEAGNLAGVVVLPVRLDPDPHGRLRAVAQERVLAKRQQRPSSGNTALAGLSRIGLLRYVSRHQRMVHLVESNMAGPPARLSLLGAPLLTIVPIGTLVGNLSLAFLALSYAGRLTVTVLADADQYPDLPVLVEAMRRDYRTLQYRGAG